MRLRLLCCALLLVLLTPNGAWGQSPGPRMITLDEALALAVSHNHALLAARTTIQQNEAQEITANLRPNPVFLSDAQFLPFFNPSLFSSNYLNEDAQFDLGVSYLFERGQKRQHRLQAAKDATAVTKSLVSDNERMLQFNVATQFVNIQLAESVLDFATKDLKSFQNTVDISESRYKAGDISEGDYLKIKLQLLQFQTDVSAARLARAQALASLRQLLGFESVPEDFDVAEELQYQPEKTPMENLEMMALQNRPDYRAAQLSVTAAQSQHSLAEANGKRDVTAQANYTHVAALNSASLFMNFELPIFDRNQGEIARTGYAITQSQELEKASNEQVLSDVIASYDNMHTNDQIVGLYVGGYRDESKQSRDISEYAYRRGVASLLDFLDAERSYRATELAYRQALATYLLALEQLKESVGTRNMP
jgi:cobalt-zinc-cadmium efflux system outer membrane protein